MKDKRMKTIYISDKEKFLARIDEMIKQQETEQENEYIPIPELTIRRVNFQVTFI